MYFPTQTCVLPVSQTVAAGASVEASNWHKKTAFVIYSGGATGTVQIQISPDGTNWFNKAAALTASGFVFIEEPCTHVRVNTTVIVAGGTVSAVLAGH